MSVTLVFLGRLADLAGAPEQALPAPLDWATLVASLPPALAAEVAGDKVRVAVDGALLADKAMLQAADGAEVALLPPVSGG
ncbi:MoaD/ThiS family protein [Erythrobacter arachoides]|uniref:MoaD/ThiS family protein n=1 Tax=Aurantiacibacter arachoides TaxID=1850444 RepID=A0A845A2W0_9SPHN|nr:MoaD/ThiS family protein [Aurantiacibacter arachoides]MXO93752.1 MoaD/ThiS family protein [Aurantiacibacter arachoides]GGD46911.1 molybdopterin synthase sulfur carrier subunit [Aurantiacibacter arachoides]